MNKALWTYKLMQNLMLVENGRAFNWLPLTKNVNYYQTLNTCTHRIILEAKSEINTQITISVVMGVGNVSPRGYREFSNVWKFLDFRSSWSILLPLRRSLIYSFKLILTNLCMFKSHFLLKFILSLSVFILTIGQFYQLGNFA